MKLSNVIEVVIEVVLPRDVRSADGRRVYNAGERVELRLSVDTDVRVVRPGEKLAEGVTATLRELVGADVARFIP